jgi:hypothetical protein
VFRAFRAGRPALLAISLVFLSGIEIAKRFHSRLRASLFFVSRVVRRRFAARRASSFCRACSSVVLKGMQGDERFAASVVSFSQDVRVMMLFGCL